MQESPTIQKKESSAVQAHVQMLQSIIQKMNDNSKQCKQWCVAIQSIIVGLNKEGMSVGILFCSILVSLLLMCQDAGFLAFSRDFRKQQQEFINHVNNSNDLFEKEVFSIKRLDGCKRFCAFLSAISSPFVFPYYMSFVILMIVIYFIN